MRKNAGIMTSGIAQPLLPASFQFHRSKFLWFYAILLYHFICEHARQGHTHC